MAKKKLITEARAPGSIDAYISLRMRERRLALGLTLADVAAMLGVSVTQIAKYENGKNRVSAARLFDICEALELPLEAMFERDPMGRCRR